ncbi:MAG: hypothetical protein R3Y13_01695 [bacterium]
MYHQTYAFNVVSIYPLSINYNTSELIDSNNYKDVKFSIVNNGEEDLKYVISLSNVRGDKSMVYKLSGSTEEIEGNFEVGAMTESVLIKAGEIHYYTLNIEDVSKSDFSAELVVTKEEANNLVFYETILSDNEVEGNEPLTKIGSEVATKNEGLIKLTFDDLSTIYYFRGAVNNNYVSFADMTWRIVRINENNSVKLILDDEIDSMSKYYESGYTFFKSTAYSTLSTWYNVNLNVYDNLIDQSNFCNDFSVVDSTNNVYAAYNRVVENQIASLECVDDLSQSKIGLLTVDEVVYAGASVNDENEKFYLINSNLTNPFYLMSSAILKNKVYYPFAVDIEGNIVYDEQGTNYNGLRPVINISREVIVTGTGIKSDPYVIN